MTDAFVVTHTYRDRRLYRGSGNWAWTRDLAKAARYSEKRAKAVASLLLRNHSSVNQGLRDYAVLHETDAMKEITHAVPTT